MKLEFFVPGVPITSGSKQGYYNKKTGKMVMAPDNPKQKDWQAAVKMFAMEAAKDMTPTNEPVALMCIFGRKRPGSHYRTNGEIKPRFLNAQPTTRPDSLKLCRAVEDAMSGIMYKDDANICSHFIQKRYCKENEKPGVRITVQTYEEEKFMLKMERRRARCLD